MGQTRLESETLGLSRGWESLEDAHKGGLWPALGHSAGDWEGL